MGDTAVLLLAHGTPDRVEDIPEYLHNVTSGRSIPDSVLEEVKHRYSLIGRSPLTSITLRQAQLLSEALKQPVYVGMRNWRPYIKDTICQIRADGKTRIAALCLAPQNSRTSVGLYKKALFQDADGLSIDFVESWHDHRLLISAFAERLRAALARDGKDPAVIEYLVQQESSHQFFSSVLSLVETSVNVYQKRGFTDLMVSFGCTGGQHRSVYFAEQLAKHFGGRAGVDVVLRHIGLESLQK